MTNVGIQDFSTRDVSKPEVKRTEKNLSALINFAKFREGMLESFVAKSEKYVCMKTTDYHTTHYVLESTFTNARRIRTGGRGSAGRNAGTEVIYCAIVSITFTLHIKRTARERRTTSQSFRK